jgi:valacyclovir hydrolase
MLLPGWAGSIIEFDRLRHELSVGFRVIAADLPGSGRSLPQPRDYAPTFYAEDADTFGTHVSRRPRRSRGSSGRVQRRW